MIPTTNEKRNYGFWNWGTGIAITIAVAIGLMTFLVYKTTTIEFEMAEQDYYAQELKFNDKIKATQNAKLLSSKIQIVQDHQFITIHVPEECIVSGATGNILLYRPSAQKNDLHLKFSPDNHGNIVIEKEKFIPGIYRLKADWQMNGLSYYEEQSFYVEKDNG